MAAYTMPSCGSGLGSSHPAGHAGALTPATVHRADASHLSKHGSIARILSLGCLKAAINASHRQGFASLA